jgi:hypothetical protein
MRELTFDIDDPNLAYILTLSIRAQRRRLVCGAVTVRQREGSGPVTGSALRSLPLESYVTLVRRNLLRSSAAGRSLLLVQEIDRTSSTVSFEPPTIDAIRGQEVAERRRPLSQTLPEVATVYRRALADPDDVHAPTAAVALHFHYSRGHAARLVSQARKLGHLGDARPGVGGEVQPDQEDE